MHTANLPFRNHVAAHLPPLINQADARQRIHANIERWLAILLIDFEPARPILDECYCPRKGGAPHRDPVVLLRSLTLMLLFGFTSINKWVKRLKGEVELRVLSGFLPDKAAGVGTFYDFLHRILDGKWQPRCPHAQRPSRRVRARSFLRNLDKEKEAVKAEPQSELAVRNQGRVAALVDQALERKDQPLPDDLCHRLNEILMRCAVVPSALRGLLGDLRRLVVSADGTTLPSAADGDGRRVCDCRSQGKSTCDCLRRYSDPDATWGFDSSSREYYFGNRLHHFSARGAGPCDLPLLLSIAGAHTPDVVAGVDGLERLRKRLALPDLGAILYAAIYDAGYDAAAFHVLHRKNNIHPLIPLAQQSKTPADANGIPRDDEGRPLCPAGLPMRLHQRTCDQDVCNCPVKRPGRENGKLRFKVHLDECPNKTLCEPSSKMGPVYHIRRDGDPRLNPSIPRGSTQYKDLFKQRTATERFHASLKSKGQLARGAYRRQHLTLAAAVLHAIGLHAGAWIRPEFGTTRPQTVTALLEWLGATAPEALPQAA